MNKQYKVVNGTSYDCRTNDQVIKILEICRENNTRIILDYGNTETGESWNEVYDITGRIGRSTGINKIPLIIHNKRSLGGPSILDHCIIGIKTSIGKIPLYHIWDVKK
jgi:hypothetical protein